MSYERQAVEFLKCRKSIFYFIYNYVYLEEVGGAIKIDHGRLHSKTIRSVKTVINCHKLIFMASRQLGKSSTASMIIDYVANFFPGSQIIIINMNKSAAFENLKRIKFVHQRLPKWLASPLKYDGDRKSFLEFENGSVIKTFFYSTTTGPDSLARSLTAPCLYIDEAAFIPYIKEGFGSAQPVLSKAREQAIKNDYPYFIMVTSTPNGTKGTGAWFHSMYNNSLDSDQIYDGLNSLVPDYPSLLSNPSHNSFVKVRYHWSEINSKSWYQEQCRELNFDKRRINQELDLLFVGGTECIFDDEFLSELTPSPPDSSVYLKSKNKLDIFCPELDPGDYYILGVDTAKSLTGDYCSIQIVKYSNMEQVAEYYARVGSTSKFAEDIIQVLDWIREAVGNRFLLGIENNSMGCAVIEHIDEHEEYNYTQYLYNSKDDGTLGINTNRQTKPRMIAFLFDELTPDPTIIHSHGMVDQLSVIERKPNGTVSAQRGSHDDRFMAYAMCAYTKHMTLLEIEPLLNPEVSKKIDNAKQTVIHDLTSSIIDPNAVNIHIPRDFDYNPDRPIYTGEPEDKDSDPSMASIIGDLF